MSEYRSVTAEEFDAVWSDAQARKSRDCIPCSHYDCGGNFTVRIARVDGEWLIDEDSIIEARKNVDGARIHEAIVTAEAAILRIYTQSVPVYTQGVS